MASLTLADAASRAAPMTEERKPKRWRTRAAKSADAPNPIEQSDEGKPGKPGLARARARGIEKHTTASKGSLYKNRD